MAADDDFDLHIKLLMLGDTGVGKAVRARARRPRAAPRAPRAPRRAALSRAARGVAAAPA